MLLLSHKTGFQGENNISKYAQVYAKPAKSSPEASFSTLWSRLKKHVNKMPKDKWSMLTQCERDVIKVYQDMNGIKY